MAALLALVALAPSTSAVAAVDPAAAEAAAEAERAEREEQEKRRTELLRATLAAAREDLSDGESSLLAALAGSNRAAGQRVVAALDLEDAEAAVEEVGRRAARAQRRADRARTEGDQARKALAEEAAAAYRSASTSHTAPMIAMEALVRSRTPGDFVTGLGYLEAMVSSQVEAVHEADDEQERATRDRRSAERARQRAEAAVDEARQDLAAAEHDAARTRARLDALLDGHTGRAAELLAFAGAQADAARAADVVAHTPVNVELAEEIAALARRSVEVVERVRSGSGRILAGKDGVPAWRDFACPVDGPVRFVNDWGFPRSGGRSHEGTDVFAERGTPIVAMADAVVQRVSLADAGLGGRTVTYEVDGHRVYNAHLDTVADGLQVGDPLEAGQKIGTVGTSGNARTTPPHNHVGLYLPDGAPVNPYPILRRACR